MWLKYSLATEGLDEQARLIMPHWDLPAALERKRVTTVKENFNREDSWIAAAERGRYWQDHWRQKGIGDAPYATSTRSEESPQGMATVCFLTEQCAGFLYRTRKVRDFQPALPRNVIKCQLVA